MMKQYKRLKETYVKHVASKIDLQFNMLQVWSSVENRETLPCTLYQGIGSGSALKCIAISSVSF